MKTIRKSTLLRRAMKQGCVMMPGAFNAATARLVERAGFPAVQSRPPGGQPFFPSGGPGKGPPVGFHVGVVVGQVVHAQDGREGSFMEHRRVDGAGDLLSGSRC